MPSFMLRGLDTGFMARAMIRRLAAWLGVVPVAIVCAGCAYSNPTQPTPPPVSDVAPAFLTLGNPSTGVVTAYVQNAHGAAISGTTVQFSSDVGALAPASAATGADGRASTNVTASGDAHITATAGTISAHTTVLAPTTPTPNPNPTPTPTPGPTPTPAPPLPSVFLNVSSNASTGVPLAFSVSSSATGATWQWVFGDGTSTQTTGFTTSHTYAAAGVYTASVFGTGTAVANATITVTNAPPAPTPSISVGLAASPTSVAVGGSTTLTATATSLNGAPTVTNYAFDCNGDGVTIVNTSANSTTCTYGSAGTIVPRVTATGGTVTGSGSTTVTVTPPPLFVNVVPVPSTAPVGTSITFTATVSSTGPVPASLQWQWDDESNGTIDFAETASSPRTRITSYGTTGPKTMKVIVTDPLTLRTVTGTVNVTIS